MIDHLTPWPAQDQTHKPGRRAASDGEPKTEPAMRSATGWKRIAGEHHEPARPGRADPRETAHLIAETIYHCSRCQGENTEAATICRLCGVRFRTLVLPAEEAPVTILGNEPEGTA